jgi:hypothetical protein
MAYRRWLCKAIVLMVLRLVYYLEMTREKQKHPRTYARNRSASVSRRGYEKVLESDSTYFLKLVICVLLGTLWLKFGQPISVQGILFGGIPAGLLIGLILVNRFEKLQSDRKIWYATLIVVTIISYFVPAGIVI